MLLEYSESCIGGKCTGAVISIFTPLEEEQRNIYVIRKKEKICSFINETSSYIFLLLVGWIWTKI